MTNPAPRGYKILLEILSRNKLSVEEVPFCFADREAGESKAGMSEGLRFVRQLVGPPSGVFAPAQARRVCGRACRHN